LSHEIKSDYPVGDYFFRRDVALAFPKLSEALIFLFRQRFNSLKVYFDVSRKKDKNYLKRLNNCKMLASARKFYFRNFELLRQVAENAVEKILRTFYQIREF
jgi:hypothetical protein